MKWTIDEAWSGKISFKRRGKIGANYEIDGAHSVELATHYNGSGGASFGGAHNWPIVKSQVGFSTGQDNLAAKFAEAQKQFIDDWLERHTNGK
jgi:hypothetical protein